jgi:hypothetical protein
LYRNRIGDEGAKALSVSPYVSGVGLLELGGNQFTPEGAAAFRVAKLSNVHIE